MDVVIMKCLIRLAYVGTPFVGFQMQPNGRTIQGELQSIKVKYKNNMEMQKKKI